MGRKKYRNIMIWQLLGYRLPAAGIMSILHRVSGASLFLLLPFLIYLFGGSLSSKDSYIDTIALIKSPFVLLILAGLRWAYIHHFFAGIRHLICDFHIGLEKTDTNKWGIIVILFSLLVTGGVFYMIGRLLL